MARKRKARPAYRSKFEARLGDDLDRAGVSFGYETETFSIVVPVRGVRCSGCQSGDVVRNTRFTPDFFLPRYVVEAKGRFTANDRKRVLALLESADWSKKANGRQFGMLFMRDNTLSKSSKTRYSEWCRERGILFAVGQWPQEWLK